MNHLINKKRWFFSKKFFLHEFLLLNFAKKKYLPSTEVRDLYTLATLKFVISILSNHPKGILLLVLLKFLELEFDSEFAVAFNVVWTIVTILRCTPMYSDLSSTTARWVLRELDEPKFLNAEYAFSIAFVRTRLY